jgi:UDP-sulfoquinovose synthase
MVAKAARTAGLDAKVAHLTNPRTELEDHYYNAKHQALIDLGLQPHLLDEALLLSLLSVAQRYAERIDPVLLQEPSVTWAGGGNEVWQRYSQSAGHPTGVPG